MFYLHVIVVIHKKMSEFYRESALNSRILAGHFRQLCEQFSPPYKDGIMWANNQKAESNNEILYFLSQIGKLIRDGKVDSQVFKDNVKNIKEPSILHVEVLWYLEVTKIMTLSEYIQYHECNNNEEIITHISREVYNHLLALTTNHSKLRREMLKDYIRVLGHSEKRNGKAAFYQAVLNFIKSNLKEFFKWDETYEDHLDFMKVSDIFNESKLSCDVIKMFFIQILNSLLEGTFQSARFLIKKQERIKNSINDSKIREFFNILGKYCEHTELVVVFEGLLLDTSKGIDWDNMFCFIKFLGGHIKDGWNCVRKVCSSIVNTSLQNSDERLLSYGFLIARQGCFEKSNCFFPSYLQWFSTTFSSESRRPINSKQISTFFFNFLTDLIPFDSTYYLRVHINQVPWVPGYCQSILNEYITVVKTHLTDLNVSVELGICENTTDKSAPVFDVENVVKHFERTNEILNSVFQASMFCKDYYEKKFLVQLLSKFEGKKSARHKVIMKLHSLGKIPNSMFKNYKSIEKKK